MTKYHRVFPGIVLFLLPYFFVILAYYLLRNLWHGISFSEHRDALGAAIASYSGTIIAILIAALTFMIGVGGRKITKARAYGYMTSVVILYALSFAELGIIFFMGVFLMATSKTPIPLLPSLSIGLAATSLMHLSILLIQVFNFSKQD